MTDAQLLRMSELQKTLNQHGDGSLTPKEQAELLSLQTQLRDEISEQANGNTTAKASAEKPAKVFKFSEYVARTRKHTL